MLTRNFLTAALIVAGCAVPASASLTTYATLSSFQAATTSDTFSNISFAQGMLYTTSTSDLGVVFSTSSTVAPYLTGETNIGGGWPAGSVLVSTNSTGGNTLTITLPTAVSAIALYAGLVNTDDQIQISVSDVGGGTPDTFSVEPSVNVGAPYFLGVTTNTSFSTFTVSSSNGSDKLTLDAMQTGQAQTPELATLLLVGTGLLLMGYFRRRAIRRQPLRAAIA